MSTPIFPPEKMDQLLGLLVPDNVRKEGREKLQECLCNMFDVAAQIGHQQRAKELACAREEGYEAGCQEGWRECQARPHSKASTAWSRANSVSAVTETETHSPSPSPLSRSLCAMGTQTDVVTIPASLVSLNWAEDAEALPIPSPHPPLTPPTPRDFSVLVRVSHDHLRVYSAAAADHRIHPHLGPSRIPFFRQHAKSTVYYHHPQKNTPHSRSPFRFTTPSNSFSPGPMLTQLDWDHDPRLRALRALGWVRQ
ncbi:hypothetical protein B0H14DRAFT_2631333 [Mycena olivaceomarginata]|nr:hypothetical protein B0H14DRAFT_2631333 [Mycena olivaceomarginata]